MVTVKAESVLMSYYFFDGKSYDTAREVLRTLQEGNVWLMVDSGTHSFLTTYAWLDPRKTGAAKGDPEGEFQRRVAAGLPTDPKECIDEINAYHDRYVKWVKTFYAEGLIHSWAELDIDALVTMEHVRWWRQFWEKEDLLSGLIVTLHPTAGGKGGGQGTFTGINGGQTLADVKEMLSGKYRYAAVTGGEKTAIYMGIFSQYKQQLAAEKVKMHGWGMTTPRAINTQPWYSVDSSSWSGFGRWGIIWFYNHGKKEALYGALEMCPTRGNTTDEKDASRLMAFTERKLWDEVESYGLREGIEKMDPSVIDLWNASQWAHLQRMMMRETRNAYWLSPNEKMEIVMEKREEKGSDTELTIRADFALGSREESWRRVEVPQLEVGRLCNTCVVQDKCPMFEKNAGCKISFLRPIRTKGDIEDACQQLIELQFDRVQFAAMVERLQGGFLDGTVSNGLSQFMGMLAQMKSLSDNRDEVVVKAKGAGLISRLFGGLVNSTPTPAPRTTIEVPDDK